jgi:hypothetical protein
MHIAGELLKGGREDKNITTCAGTNYLQQVKTPDV